MKTLKPSSQFTAYTWVLAAVWTITIALSLAWNIIKENEHMLEEAYGHAKLTYESDLKYRRWAARHGGVYVPVTEETPPNPYLSHIPERDIVTPSGRLLTLMNPAYMTRQVHEFMEKETSLRGHITSLNPIRPENAPDPWEKVALQAFERGETSVSSVETIKGQEYFRLMFPLPIEVPCLKCHAAQGYKLGDIRGGISVSLPMEGLKYFSKRHIVIILIGHLVMWTLALGGIFAGRRKLILTDRKRLKAAEEMKDLNADLSVLFRISAAISRTIDLDELLSVILITITKLNILNVERKGGIFIIEEGRMKLASHLGHPDAFLDLHKDMKLGDCLCGKAAETGEIIISKNCKDDIRHSIAYPEMTPHGHLILPLKSKGAVVGVLYLYLQADFEIEKEKLDLFVSIGNQIGVAIDNARLYKETKRSSLHDPLTGLANRRLMDIEFKRNLAMADRFGQLFSVILLDIDHFKKYNDTHGHTAGDQILVKVTGIISKETRGIDLNVRYGGEEFLILLPNTGSEEAAKLAERIRMAVESKTDVTISLGVSSSEQGENIKGDIIKRTDAALYKAKQKGRNRVEVIGRTSTEK